MNRLDQIARPESSASTLSQLRLYGVVARFLPVSYRNKIMLIAFLGTHVPLLTLLIFFALRSGSFWHALPVIGVALAATLLGTGATLFILNGLLRPILMTREAVSAYVTQGRLPSLPLTFTDDAGRLMADTASSLLRLDATLNTLTYVDQMTGLPNRDHLLRRLESQLAEHRPVALCVLALQNLDEIIAAYGEPGAVTAFRTMAARLQSVAAEQAIVARIDGRRFALTAAVAPDAPSLADQAKLILAHLCQDIRDDDFQITPLITMGIALAPDDAEDAQTLLNAAQTAVPAATQPDIAFYVPATQSSLRRQMELQRELRQALERREFSLHYQPVVTLDDGMVAPRIIGAEALLRWNHPSLGAISPAVFIPIAERLGLIEDIGPWILATGCRQLLEWDKSGLPPLRLAVNLSARQFSDRRLVQMIADAIGRVSLPAHRLEVEMTETAAMQDRAVTRRVFGELRELGITVAIDDFGTGYSTMSHLRDMTFDTMKIDREFVRDVDTSPSGRAICKALIELAHGLDIAVLAEGVESGAEVTVLQSYGCTIFQGFHFGRPVPSEDFARLLPKQALPASL
ncbi:phosphodiesterase [Acidisoma cellulosilytica]|uniref:Phosphodiesterase n=1 Tax=Acidisoma cellulosilyticum TaxID=2802395 RepID=A0A964E5E7_9PROT|nr:phosphodiesterase [Acidisoma cellulosilyticum]MCB8882434.1 phosphodiesterase [Acidisoma cellulosilyticum]